MGVVTRRKSSDRCAIVSNSCVLWPWEEVRTAMIIVPTLRVGMQFVTLCVTHWSVDAEFRPYEVQAPLKPELRVRALSRQAEDL